MADLGGKPMVVRVAEQAAKSGAREVIVATDHAAIKKAVEAHGFEAEMTRKDHATGTDRLAEAALQLGLDARAIVVNAQGDEPLVPVAALGPRILEDPRYFAMGLPGALPGCWVRQELGERLVRAADSLHQCVIDYSMVSKLHT